MDVRPNFEEIEHGELDDFTYDSQGVGGATPWKPTLAPKRIGRYPFLFTTPAESRYFRAFVQNVRGRLQGFWLPLAISDTRLAANAAIGDVTLTVDKIGLAAAIGLYQQFQWIALTTWKTIYAYQISSVAVVGETEVITLASGLLKAVVAEDTNVEGLIYCRFTDDEIEYIYDSENVCSCKVSFTELPTEYVTPHLGTRPIYLYRFTRGSTVWHFADYAIDIVAGAVTWNAQDISHESIVMSGDFVNDGVQILCGTDDPAHPLRYYIESKAGEKMVCEIFQTDADTLTVDLAAPIWIGDIGQVAFQDKGVIQGTIGSVQRIAEMDLPRISIQRPCNLHLYDEFCTVDKAAYTTTATITWISPTGEWIEADAFETKITAEGDINWFALGRCYFGTQKRLIMGSKAAGIAKRMKLNSPFYGLTVGSVVTATAGCNKRIETCRDKFGNLENHLGWKYMPNQHPQIKALATPKASGGKMNKGGG
jgi:uncharacterized phage protein (TIGR02218 family)